MSKKKTSPIAADMLESKASLKSWLHLAQLRCEKCELKEAKIAYTMALRIAKRTGNTEARTEAISGLLRIAGEALDTSEVQRWENELDTLIERSPKQVPPMAWYCKGAISRQLYEPGAAQRYFHRYLLALKRESKTSFGTLLESVEEAIAKGWVMIAVTALARKHVKRALFLAEALLERYEEKNFRGINGMLYLLLANIAETQKNYEIALAWYQRSHASFLGEHNWYYHLYVLNGYARLARAQQNYPLAYWYLDLIDKAASRPEFGLLRREIIAERNRLEKDAVDLLIDSRQGTIKTRENMKISLRKQYVLLHILEALTQAHGRSGDDRDRGLSKSEIIERVWNEDYRPETHDNKLYYNINRLRKLIEPDIRKPQYLLNWKEGYRLAPGLRIQFIGGSSQEKLEGGRKV